MQTGAYSAEVEADSPDLAFSKFWIQQQPKSFAFAVQVKELRKHGETYYASTQGQLQRFFPNISYAQGSTKNSFVVVS